MPGSTQGQWMAKKEEATSNALVLIQVLIPVLIGINTSEEEAEQNIEYRYPQPWYRYPSITGSILKVGIDTQQSGELI